MLYPLTFQPTFKERVWGGRTLQQLYDKALPPDVPIGESWEIADRPDDESRITNGPLAGRSLRWLMQQHQAEVLGDAAPAGGDRFPLLCKILDAREKLSLQVHPPAPELGEPKTEMWYIAEAEPGAQLYVGLKRGISREQFERDLQRGTVADCFHTVTVRAGDVMFLPSGRVHAIGAGLVIFEIQQNSDTTFRVFDWNRVGLDGKPRELHIEQSLQSIDFDDFEPPLADGALAAADAFEARPLVRHPLFDADLVRAASAGTLTFDDSRLRVLAVVGGRLSATGGGLTEMLTAGQFCLLPAGVPEVQLGAERDARFLVVEPGS